MNSKPQSLHLNICISGSTNTHVCKSSSNVYLRSIWIFFRPLVQPNVWLKTLPCTGCENCWTKTFAKKLNAEKRGSEKMIVLPAKWRSMGWILLVLIKFHSLVKRPSHLSVSKKSSHGHPNNPSNKLTVNTTLLATNRHTALIRGQKVLSCPCVLVLVGIAHWAKESTSKSVAAPHGRRRKRVTSALGWGFFSLFLSFSVQVQRETLITGFGLLI